MRNNILLLALLLSGSFSFSQTIQESELIGLWNVVNVEGTLEAEDSEKQKLDSLIKAFHKATFHFQSDKNFTLAIDFIGIGDMMKNVHWNYLPGSASVVIQDWKLKDNLMIIVVEQKNDKVYFKLTESPLVLEVEK